MTTTRRLVVSASRGSGGASTHLAHVIPRLRAIRPDWCIELFAPQGVLRSVFGTSDEPWMFPLPDEAGGAYGARGRWELFGLPQLLARDPDALAYFPGGAPLNLALAPRAAWMSRNIIPLLPSAQWAVSDGDWLRLSVIQVLVAMTARVSRLPMCVSRHARERLARLARVSPDRIACVPHGIDPVIEHSARSEGCERIRRTQYVLHTGQAVAYRRTLELCQAYAMLARRRPDVPPLVLLGQARDEDREYERAVMKLLEPLVATGHAVVVGQVHHQDALALMASAHAFVYPSVLEDCPNVVLEAMSAGRVGVYADIPAVRELAEDAGIFAGPDPRPEALADAIEQAVFDEDARARVAGAARLRAAFFTWDRTAERTAEALAGAFPGAS